ncbi:MAG: SAM-dependent methyltransferase [Akkermansiaceae bacterium]
MKETESEFIFALTNTGSERALKLEAETMGLGWRLSYQRRGFVSFKAAADDGLFSLGALDHGLSCARRLCLSLGKQPTRADAVNKIRQHPAYLGGAIHQVRFANRRMEPGDDNPAEPVQPGDCVGTVVELGPDEFWVGLHLQGPFISPDPGGDGALVMAEDSPSRAWLKLEEATRFFELEFSNKDLIVELGCSPGGVVLALLRRGIPVIGVDPAKMAAVVMESAVIERGDAPLDGPWFYHCRKPAALVSKRDLGTGVTWFMSDMNQSPDVVLKECARFCKMAGSIRKVLITLKLTDLSQISEKKRWMDALRDMGFKTVRLQQLAVHHKEFALLALK